MSGRSYQDAINCLNSLQSNAAALAAIRTRGDVDKLHQLAIPEMNELVTRIGLTPEDLNALNVIHITGTKGKGSTSAFTDSIIRHARPGTKVGLYTSPHLVVVRERIRVNGRPLSEAEFAKYFFEVWQKLQENPPLTPGFPHMPMYFRYMTLMAFHTFKTLKVDATVLEVGIGGASDSTNVVPKPVVAGITSLGLDHVTVLGGTVEAIARQKAGIYKKDVPALTVEQCYPSADLESILRETASEVKASEFTIVKELPSKDLRLGLPGKHQRINASLAVELARVYLAKQHDLSYPEPLPESFISGLRNVKWPGRCQTVTDPNNPLTTWYLDGAHTAESLKCCVEWFVSPDVGLGKSTEDMRPQRILIFNCTSGRAGDTFLKLMLEDITVQLSTLKSSEEASSFFNQVIFCSNVTYADGHFKGDLTSVKIASAPHEGPTTQDQLREAWMNAVKEFPVDAIHSLPSIEHAIKKVREFSETRQTNVLVTGSLHLVGGVMEVAGLSSAALGDL